ncbi:hypothetical protein ABID22_003274 [Pontibacter aydingkolensis]|uniref:Outer membrane protein beta-barrel domain-containing protein n=1 Tax=Pontibacter aydingkolensis TaxID=1911536 RepID=A0ABS7CUD6_9BACT|nr:hypothetical protein [Pontibacter aydingkolensis]MBW7467455.1 hypothetical protein [Pontibacter aydingkolensis]
MKKLYLFFFALLAAYTLQAQDIITKTDKTEIKALVTEISDETIKYKLFDFQGGPVYNLKRAEVYKIVYSNGREEKFNATEPVPTYTGSPATVNTESKVGSLLGKLAEPPVPAAQTTTGNLGRTFIGVVYSRHLTFSTDSYDFETKPIFGFNVLLEKYFEPKQGSVKAPSKGYGLASTNYFGYSETIGDDIYTGSRHYFTGYLFKEIPVKNIATLGGLAGGGMSYTRGKADENNEVNPGESAGVFGGGAHLGLFAQRALTTGASGKPSFLVRLGYDIFFMSNGNSTLGANISISF